MINQWFIEESMSYSTGKAWKMVFPNEWSIVVSSTRNVKWHKKTKKPIYVYHVTLWREPGNFQALAHSFDLETESRSNEEEIKQTALEQLAFWLGEQEIFFRDFRANLIAELKV